MKLNLPMEKTRQAKARTNTKNKPESNRNQINLTRARCEGRSNNKQSET